MSRLQSVRPVRQVAELWSLGRYARMNTTSLTDTIVSALMQAAVLGGVPFLGYLAYQKWRHKRPLSEVAQRAGLQRCPWRYLALSVALALVGAGIVVIWSPPLEMLTREGSAQRQFVGLGFTAPAITRALLYGAVQTAFAEELLFRGLIAGSLSRRLSVAWANILQACIFLLPHFLLLLVMREMWRILPLVFIGALSFGWIRIKSGSILGPWIMHACGNVTMALNIAIRTA
jgi:membrane protease YdiL (CAAX protease family)